MIHLNELCTHLSASSMTAKRYKVIKHFDFSLAFCELKLGHVIFNDLESVIRLKITLNLIHLNELCTHLSACSMALERQKVVKHFDFSLAFCELKLGHVIFNDIESVIRLKFTLNLIHLNELCTHLSASSMAVERQKVVKHFDFSLVFCELKLGHVIF